MDSEGALLEKAEIKQRAVAQAGKPALDQHEQRQHRRRERQAQQRPSGPPSLASRDERVEEQHQAGGQYRHSGNVQSYYAAQPLGAGSSSAAKARSNAPIGRLTREDSLPCATPRIKPNEWATQELSEN
jgi:hypothetical protein